jgi:hypothetical protein
VRRLTLLVVLVAFVFSCGGHWVVLQGVAWTNMIRQYSEVVPFTQAVQMTFSGQYPCALCQAIAEKKNDEQGKIVTFDKSEKKMVAAWFVVAPPRVTLSPVDHRTSDPDLRTRSDAPPTPPPRGALI